MNVYLWGLIFYAAVLMTFGLVVSRRVKSSSDYLVAGRDLGSGRIFATFLAANIGAGSTVGAAGLGYQFGLSAWWWVGSAAIGTLILSQIVGPPLWRIAKQYNLATLADFLELRYGKAVKASIAILLWFGALAILAAQIIAISWILNTVADIPKWEGCLLGGTVAIVYCTAGGLVSSALVNIVELSVTMSGLLLAVPFALHAVGGWSQLHDRVSLHVGSLVAARMLSVSGAGAHQIFAWIAILVPSFIVSPGLVQKLYAARSTRAVRIGVGLNSLGQALFAFVPPILGLCALAALPHLQHPELALPTAMRLLLPRWLGVWTLASIFSAELSATDAILFMLSTSLAVDLYKTFLRPEVSSQKLLLVSRLSSVVAGVVGIMLAIALPSVISAVLIFYGLVAVALFVPVLAGLYLRHIVPTAILASIGTSVLATLISSRITHGQGLSFLSPQAIGICTAAIVVLSFRLLYSEKAR